MGRHVLHTTRISTTLVDFILMCKVTLYSLVWVLSNAYSGTHYHGAIKNDFITLEVHLSFLVTHLPSHWQTFFFLSYSSTFSSPINQSIYVAFWVWLVSHSEISEGSCYCMNLRFMPTLFHHTDVSLCLCTSPLWLSR